jgi:hypothetical protein
MPHCSATQLTRLSEACVFRLSMMKVHLPVGSRFTVRAMWSTNSGSVRVASSVGETIWPVHHVEAGGQRVEDAVRFPDELPSFPAFGSFVRAERTDRPSAQVLG